MEDGRNLPVLAEAPEARVIERAPVEPMPLSAPVAAATTGVLAGLAAMALLKAARGGFGGGGRRGAIRLGGKRGKMKIAQSQSFLIDVHLLKR
ncbi:MAG: hypothetical protein QOC77_3462 [Thermoleophilaceae bacterium]|jgi:hypothetical protein|nr:hypothetical protein [Thermoleophilaceae bacterium]MEA2469746.1 hypothetical protein [Thermoleophilaceae bacterium]